MKVQTIVMVIVILLLLYVVMKYVLNDANTMTGLMSGTEVQKIVAKDLAKDDSGLHSSNFAYSIWYYIDDWNYNYDKTKVLFGRTPQSTIPVDRSIMNIYPCPAVVFTPNTNDLMVYLETTSQINDTCDVDTTSPPYTGTDWQCSDNYCYPKKVTTDAVAASPTGCTGSCTSTNPNTPTNCCSTMPVPAVYEAKDCANHTGNPSAVESTTITNVPIQKWTNVTISVYGRSLDIYLDGKLVQTTPLAGTAQVDPDASVYITPNGGFSGWTSKFAYYPNALNPQEVWDIYSAGYGSSWLSNLFGKYNVKISFLENGTEDSSFTF